MIRQAFHNTGKLTGLLLRRHRLQLLLWLFGLVGITLLSALAYIGFYANREEMYGFAVTMQNPAMVAMVGPAYDFADFNYGVVMASEMLFFTALAVVIMNILMVGASTREDEEEGRLEMIQSLPVGRLSHLTASLVMMLLVNGLITILIALGLLALGEADFTVEGSFLYGAVISATGLFFAGLTAVCAQLAETGRGTLGLAFGAVILAYIIRAIGDVQLAAFSLFSPLGWTVRTSVFADNQWWPIFALMAGFVVLAAIAFQLHRMRDIFAGILPVRSGQRQASAVLKTLPGLVWRLERTKIWAWALGLFLMAAAFGAVLGELETYFADMQFVRDVLGDDSAQSMMEQLINYIVTVFALFATVPAVLMVLSVRREERLGRTEHFFSRSLSRNRVLGTYYGMGLLTIILLQLATASGLYLTSYPSLADPVSIGVFAAAALVFVPAIWLVMAMATLLVGAAPKNAVIVWFYLLFAFIVLYLGNLFKLPESLKKLSVFHHIPKLPGAEIEWAVLVSIAAIAILVSAMGFTGYNRRDIQG